MEEGLTKEDCIITAYREHCQALLRGHSTYSIISEMMSRKTGATHGKGGSMHYYNKKQNFYGGHGIVGAQVSLNKFIIYQDCIRNWSRFRT
jgi:pyruvate dehydrogenase E1 component alpha subunit